MTNKDAKVTLVGAGPGDPNLMTLAGVKALKSARVVLYDALVNPEVLKWATNAIKIFVGKRRGYKRFEQEEINSLIVSNALQHGHVVRLKGGDSFIFGRGSEELDVVQSFGIETAIVPGISSATSASVTQGIPLTRRGVAESFSVITGTTKSGRISKDIAVMAQTTATIVILMGMSKLPQIVKIFQQLGKGEIPVAIIQSAYTAKQNEAIGTINSILEDVKNKAITNPAVIIIGNVVKHGSYSLNSFLQDSVFTDPQLQYHE